jgi:tungstate transport system substrate-binding protein
MFIVRPMSDTSQSDGRARPSHLRSRARLGRRLLAAPLLGLLAAAALLRAPARASADSASTLTVVGTSDVSDSGLVQNVIEPDLLKADPGLTFKYVGSATGLAIQNAESGNGGPSALIVHAASLENQFVADGFSYQNQPGYAVFTNDFVLAGPKGDPAGVGAGGAHNVAQAFADVATAGIAGKATFLTRGGTVTASGTTVQEHGIWALVDSAKLAPAGLVLCDVSAADGGGMSPIKSSVQSTSGQACPDSGTVSGTDAPSWYVVNAGASQGANAIATNACTVGTSGANTCYTLTDRGTFDYLSSGTSPSAGTVGIPNLAVLASDNSAAAPGGQYELTNYFHVYIINPSKPGESVNLAGAQDFVKLLTSQAFQAQLKTYLPSSAGGPPFTADASPLITTTKNLPGTYTAGEKATVTGTLTNAEPGYPALAKQTVAIDEIVGTLPVQVASGTTSATGTFSISFVPPSTGSYQLATGQLTQVENATLSPTYSDTLSPAATTPVKITVHSAVTTLRVLSRPGRAIVLGTVSPSIDHVKATVTVYDRANGEGRFKKVATDRLGASDANFAVGVNVAAGTWQFEVKYADPKAVDGATSQKVKATIAATTAVGVTLKSAKVSTTALTVTGSVSAKATAATWVTLLGERTAGTSARFVTLGTVTVKKGKTTFTVHAKLRAGISYVLDLEYAPKGVAASYSGLKTVSVKAATVK